MVRALVVVIGVGIAQGAVHAEAPLCRAEVVLAAPRAFVGEPVLHRVRIVQRREVVDMRWETSLSFPALRVEPIFGPSGPPEDDPSGQVIEERRVLFPARAGRLALPAARIACESAGRVETAEVPAAELFAEEPPREGRPAGWTRLIGPVEVTTYATPDHVELGGSVSIAVTVRGPTNVWAAPVSFAGAFPAEVAELFERPPELARDMGRTLVLRSYRSFDLVPRRSGPLEIPELRVAYFDPGAKRYAEAHAPAIPIEVTTRSERAAPPEPAPPAHGPPRYGGGHGRVAVAALALGLGLGLGLAAGYGLGRRERGARRGAPTRAGRELRRGGGELARALAAGDAEAAAAAAARSLRLSLERALPGARTLAVEELTAAAPSGLAPAVALLARLEHARYAGGDPAALLALAREAAGLAR